jgi:hypothetical protein
MIKLIKTMTRSNPKTYKLPMSREDWECYLDTPDEVVELINSFCQKALDTAEDPKSALLCIYQVLNNFVEFGLRDTECDHVAVKVVNAHFKDQPDVNRYSVGFV